MIIIKNILVATDFGPASDTALRYGGGLVHHGDVHPQQVDPATEGWL